MFEICNEKCKSDKIYKKILEKILTEVFEECEGTVVDIDVDKYLVYKQDDKIVYNKITEDDEDFVQNLENGEIVWVLNDTLLRIEE